MNNLPEGAAANAALGASYSGKGYPQGNNNVLASVSMDMSPWRFTNLADPQSSSSDVSQSDTQMDFTNVCATTSAKSGSVARLSVSCVYCVEISMNASIRRCFLLNP
jgi:hypothetical protein